MELDTSRNEQSANNDRLRISIFPHFDPPFFPLCFMSSKMISTGDMAQC